MAQTFERFDKFQDLFTVILRGVPDENFIEDLIVGQLPIDKQFFVKLFTRSDT